MSHYTIKNPDTIILESNEFDIDVNTLKLTNAPPTNNANTKIIARNIVTGNAELVDKSTLAGDITMSNPSVSVGKQDILINPGTNVPLPGNFNFRSLIAGSGITFTPGVNDLTISATVPGTSSITVNNVGSGSGTIAATFGTIPLPGVLSIKTLTAGTGIALTNGGTSITITSTASGNNIYNSDGTIPGIIRTATLSSGTTLRFIGAVAGAAVVIFDNLSQFNVTTNNTIDFRATNAINVGSTPTPLQTINIGSNGSVGSTVNIGAGGQINLTGADVRMTNIPSNIEDYYLSYNIFSGRVSYYPLGNHYGIFRFTSQSPSTSGVPNPSQAVGITGVLGTTSAAVTAAGTSDGLRFTGTVKNFYITFTCTLTAGTGSQNISVGLFHNGVPIPNTTSSGFIGATGSLTLTTLPIIASLTTNDIVRVGFGSDILTGITFSGNLYIKSVST